MSERYDSANIFARILRGEIPSERLYEDEATVAIMDVMPQSKGHCLVLPKTLSRNLLDVDDATLSAVMVVVARLARAVKSAFSADGVFVCQFNEAPAGQTVFHLHVHVIPRYDGVELVRHAGAPVDQAVLAGHAAVIREALARS